jgi:hypothetical protein
MKYKHECPICNKSFVNGYYHSSRWKLFCHMSKGKGHKNNEITLIFPIIITIFHCMLEKIIASNKLIKLI